MYSTRMTDAEDKSDFWLTTDTPYTAVTGELRFVYCEQYVYQQNKNFLYIS